MTLFDDGRTLTEPAPVAPLAARVRPRTLDEVVGHRGLIGPGGALRRLAEGDSATTPHRAAAGPPNAGRPAENATVKAVGPVNEDARGALSAGGARTLLFLDE